MITKQEYERAAAYTRRALKNAGIAITDEEARRIEIADFGLGDLDNLGLQLLVYVNTERCCAKEMCCAFPDLPEHIHNGGLENGKPYEGKEETFRVRPGDLLSLRFGRRAKRNDTARVPDTEVTVFHEIVLREGEQYTLSPGTWHWFQAGDEGAIISEFSTKSRDEADVFRDARVQRIPRIEE